MYSLAGITIDTTVDVFIGQITEQSVDPRIENMIVGGSGKVDAEHISVNQQAPVVRFTTSMVKTVLDNVGINGLAIDAGAGTPVTVILWWRRRSGAGWAAGSVNVKQTINKGLLVPASVPAQQGGGAPAMITCDLYAIQYTTLEPIVTAKDQAYAFTDPTQENWTIGPAKINGTSVTVEQRLNIDFGLNVVPIFGGGGVWPSDIHITSRQPRIELDTLEAEWLDDTTGLGGKGIAISSETAVWLRKVTEGATTVAEATAEHIQFTVAEGMVQPGNVRGTHGEDAVFPVTIIPTYDGSNAILAIDTVAAIN